FDVEEEEKQALAKITAPIARVTAPIRAVEADTLPLMQRIYGKHRTYQTYNAPRKPTQGRLVRRRWQRDTSGQRRQKNLRRILSLAIVAAMLLFVLVPAGVGLAAYGAYNNLSTLTHDGVNHLLKVKTILNVSKDDPTAALDA